MIRKVTLVTFLAMVGIGVSQSSVQAADAVIIIDETGYIAGNAAAAGADTAKPKGTCYVFPKTTHEWRVKIEYGSKDAQGNWTTWVAGEEFLVNNIGLSAGPHPWEQQNNTALVGRNRPRNLLMRAQLQEKVPGLLGPEWVTRAVAYANVKCK